MKTAKMNFAVNYVVNYVKNVAITMALLGWLISWAAPAASAQAKIVGWAVGNSGTILYTPDATDKTKWGVQAAPKDTPKLNGVASVDGTMAWAVGNSPQPGGKNKPGTILYWDGTVKKPEWVIQDKDDKAQPIPSVHLHGVSFVDNTHGWAVGDSDGTSATILYTKGTNGRIWAKLTNPADKRANLYGVSFVLYKGKYYGWVVGTSGTVLYSYGDGTTWTAGTGPPKDKGAFRSVSGYFSGLDRQKNPVFAVYAVGDKDLGVWKSTDSGKTWTQADKIGGQLDLKAIQMFTASDIWVGQTGADDVFNWTNKNDGWQNRKTGIFDDVYGLSGFQLKGADSIWVVGKPNKDGVNIARGAIADKKFQWTSHDNPQGKTAQQLNGIVIVKPPSGQKKLVTLEELTSPESGAADVNYVSVTGSGFPDGNILAGNVAVELAAECHGPASASTSAVSMVSGSGDSELLSFLLPGGLAPGQYFVSISDSEDGEANFESSNCSEVNVSQ